MPVGTPLFRPFRQPSQLRKRRRGFPFHGKALWPCLICRHNIPIIERKAQPRGEASHNENSQDTCHGREIRRPLRRSGCGFTLGEKELIYAAAPGSIVGMTASTTANTVYASARRHLYLNKRINISLLYSHRAANAPLALRCRRASQGHG
jgi:hypothetical protein